jgi:hypothetical protein
MNGSANMLARLHYGDIITDLMYQMEREVRSLDGDLENQSKAGKIVQELWKSYDWLMNPSNSTWANRATSLGFLWYLTNPSTALVNISQVPLMTFPELAARFGGGKAFKQVHKAMGDYTRVINRRRQMGVSPNLMAFKATRQVLDENGQAQDDVRYMTYKDETEYLKAVKQMKQEGYEIDRAITPLEAAMMETLGGEFEGDMGRFLNFLETSGRVSRSATTQLAGLGEDAMLMQPGMGGKASRFADFATRVGGFLFHHSEVSNREVTGLAAYRLMRQRLNNLPREEAHQKAMDYAFKAIAFTQGEYSNANRARFMRSDWARVAFLFRTYSQLMTWRLTRDIYQSMPFRKGVAPEERAVARKRLGWMMMNTAILGGAMGLPMYTIVVGAVAMAEALFGDDDDPWDFELWLNKELTDTLGEQGREMVMHGPAGTVFGAGEPMSLQSRLSLDLIRLWIRKPPGDLEGQQLAMEYLRQFAGPVFGMGAKVAQGMHDMNRGLSEGSTDLTYRGFESALPSPLANMVKAWRYETEGVMTRRGDKLINEVNGRQLVMQAMGFSPAEIANVYQQNNLLYNYKGQLDRRAQALIRAVVFANESQDTEMARLARQKIAQFNRTNPRIAITQERIRNAMMNRRRAHAKSIDGMFIPSRGMQVMLEEKRY